MILPAPPFPSARAAYSRRSLFPPRSDKISRRPADRFALARHIANQIVDIAGVAAQEQPVRQFSPAAGLLRQLSLRDEADRRDERIACNVFLMSV